MLINESYFSGPLTIAQLGQSGVVDDLYDFIQRMEPTIMAAALGYDLYDALIQGIDVGSDEIIDEKWLKLLNGEVFTTRSGIKKRWCGLAVGSNTSTVSSSLPEPLTIKAGITPGFDVGGRTFTKESLLNWKFSVEREDVGTVERGVVWDYKDGGGVIFLDTDYQIQDGEIWIIHYLEKRLSVTSNTGTSFHSPIAGFVWAAYMSDKAKQVTGTGIKKQISENSVNVNPASFICAVYNEAYRDIQVLWEYLQVKGTEVYPEYSFRQIDHNYFVPKNEFGI